jgi:hypothetical protein
VHVHPIQFKLYDGFVPQCLMVTSASEFTTNFCGVRVFQFLDFCVMFCRSLFVLLSFFFWLFIVLSVFCPSLINGFWLPLRYLQTFSHCVVHVHPIQFKLYDGFVPQCLLQVYRFWDVYPIRLGVIDQFVISFVEIP